MKPLHLLPMGTMDEETLSTVEVSLWETFGFDILRLPAESAPEFSFDPIRNQYNSEIILRKLVDRCPVQAFRMLAVVDADLFIPMLSFVFGQAQLLGKVAVVSSARMHQEFYGLPPQRRLMLERVAKECVHEIGHTLGLIHCLERSCPMSLATGISQLDLKGDDLCRNCLIALRGQLQAAELS